MPMIIKEPINKVYKELIEYSLKTSDAFMLVTCDFYKDKSFKQKVIPFLEKLKPYLIKIRHNTIWPGTEIMEKGKNKYNIYLFKACEDVKDILLEPGNLYNWKYPYFPEDLSFFRNGNCWFASTSHEKMSCICTKIDEIRYLSSIGIEFEEFTDVYNWKIFEEDYNI